MVSVVGTQEATTPHPVPAEIEGESDFISPDATLELLVKGEEVGMVLLGDVKVGCNGNVYFTDIPFLGLLAGDQLDKRPAGAIWVYDPVLELVQVFRSPSGMTNGIAFDADCNMVAAEGADFGGRQMIRVDHQTGLAKIIAGLFEDASFNAPNDLAIDEKGRIYFTDPRYDGHEPIEQEVTGVYRVDPDGVVERIIADIKQPNGIAISPDQETLYVANFTGGKDTLWAYDLRRNGTVASRRALVDYPKGGADGFVVDKEGNLWVAVLGSKRPGVYAYSPQGAQKVYIPLPGAYNVGFGRGKSRNVLYITALTNLYRITVMKEGYHLP